MSEFIIQYEIAIRLCSFLGIFLVMGVWETFAPRRVLLVSRWLRWLNNLAIVVLNTLLLRLVFPAAAVALALFASERGWGILHYYELPSWLAFIIAVLVLDFIIWSQHVMTHSIPLLWRLHRVHHADLDFDVTTGSRFHPIEIIISMLIKFAAIMVLGPSAVAVIVFEVLLNATAMFNHSNIKLPERIDKYLRKIIVTPDMHRVHHSVEDDEANSNFGFNLSIWDQIFGTYCPQPRAGHEAMTIGIHHFRDTRLVSMLPGMLLLPFKGKITQYTINRRTWD